MGSSQQGRPSSLEGAKEASPEFRNHGCVGSRGTRTEARARKNPAGGQRKPTEKHRARMRGLSAGCEDGGVPLSQGTGKGMAGASSESLDS